MKTMRRKNRARTEGAGYRGRCANGGVFKRVCFRAGGVTLTELVRIVPSALGGGWGGGSGGGGRGGGGGGRKDQPAEPGSEQRCRGDRFTARVSKQEQTKRGAEKQTNHSSLAEALQKDFFPRWVDQLVSLKEGNTQKVGPKT